ncbi:hypothetical protein BDV95DRAFT_58317 [Massariosphaeria phaeospora]|uniref:Uncharacterized protein n=1 Tax=Massariosphaeria phaeospora TaxID=100035 RepID=A0A7C8MNK5_9PLEO|nr:hypothetical protein BDV95DRAFT_58317 [Massariosphaeria phaeospora]
MGNTTSQRVSPTLSPLETLPLPVLEDICEYLEHNEPGRTSLFAFALASQRCCEAAERQRFERISIVQGSVKKLERDLKIWNATLASYRRARYVRRVRVSGCLLVKGRTAPWEAWGYCPCRVVLDIKEKGHTASYLESLPIGLRSFKSFDTRPTTFKLMDSHLGSYNFRTSRTGSTLIQEEKEEAETENGVHAAYGKTPGECSEDGNNETANGDEDGFLALGIPTRAETVVHVPDDVAHRQNEAWKMLAAFISQFPGLRDFMWDSTDTFPSPILSMIHTKLPRCRIHVSQFCLRSLLQDKRDIHDIDDDDYALATSPCLYSVAVAIPYAGYDQLAHVDYNKEVLVQLASGLAPNLHTIYVDHLDIASSRDLYLASRTPRPAWRSLAIETQKQQRHAASPARGQSLPPSKGSLHTLIRTCQLGPGIGVTELEHWRTLTHFDQLRHLHLGHGVSLDALTLLAQMALQGELASLHTFKLVRISTWACEHYYAEVRDACSLLLTHLPPLKALQLRPIGGETLRLILEYHGATMQRLDIYDRECIPLSREHIEDLAVQCPRLTHLDICVPRSSSTEGSLAAEDIRRMFTPLRHLTYLRADEFVQRDDPHD